MLHDLSILAISEKDLTKIIFGGIFMVIWVVGAIMSSYAKKREAERRERVRQELERAERSAPNWGDVASQPPPMPVPPPMPPQRTVPPRAPRPIPAPPKAPPPVPHRPPPQVKKPKQPKKRKQREEMPAAQPVDPGESVTQTLLATEPVVAAVRPARRSATADAGAIRSWMRPGTMRQQFILTEILQPPLALRDRER